MKRPGFPVLERHPLSTAYGDMPEGDLAALKEDIRINGQQMAIILLDGKVLDGWHRYTAVSQLAKTYPRDGWMPLLDDGEIDDPAAFVQSMNAHRRHLTLVQRIEAFALVHGLDMGERGTAAKVAKGLGTTAANISRALKVPKAKEAKEKPAPDLASLEKQLVMAEGRVASLRTKIAELQSTAKARPRRR